MMKSEEMFNILIKDSITDWLGHKPSEDEYKIMLQYVHDAIADQVNAGHPATFTHAEAALLDCRKENFVKCPECGDYFLPSGDEWNEIEGTCTYCRPFQDPDNMPGGWDYIQMERTLNY